MGTTLTGTTPQDTYDSLIKVTDNGPLSGTGKFLSDGLGNDSVLALSTTAVGVSETSPLGKLHVKTADTSVSSVSAQGNLLVLEDSENGLSILSSAAGAGYILFGDSADNDVAGIIYDHSSNAMIFNTNAAERLRITSAGNVGIGTTAPAANLHIASATDGGIRIQGGASGLSYIDLADTASGTPAGSIAYNHIANAITFSTDTNVERARITSNGLSFNGDTAAANALDDYEEGTFTPSLIFSGGSTGITYSIQAGKYVKIGSKVSVNCYVVLSNKGSSTGNARIDGLPFTVPNNSANYSPATIFLDGGITYTGQAQGFANINSTSVNLGNVTEAGTATALTDTNFSNSSAIMVSLTYFV